LYSRAGDYPRGQPLLYAESFRQRNKTRDRIKWMFTTDKARAKLGRVYPATANESKSR
jgi:hypothetical protein